MKKYMLLLFVLVVALSSSLAFAATQEFCLNPGFEANTTGSPWYNQAAWGACAGLVTTAEAHSGTQSWQTSGAALNALDVVEQAVVGLAGSASYKLVYWVKIPTATALTPAKVDIRAWFGNVANLYINGYYSDGGGGGIQITDGNWHQISKNGLDQAAPTAFGPVNPEVTQVIFRCRITSLDPSMKAYIDDASVLGDVHTISGKVQDAGGVGLANVKVYASATSPVDTGTTAVSVATSDASGNYSFKTADGVVKYVVAKGFDIYNNSAEVTVPAGTADVTGVNLTMNVTTNVTTFHGRVVDGVGVGVANFPVTFTPQGVDPIVPKTVKTDATGYYTCVVNVDYASRWALTCGGGMLLCSPSTINFPPLSGMGELIEVTPDIVYSGEVQPLVGVKAAGNPAGTLATWANTGSLAGSFVPNATAPYVDAVGGKKAVWFNGAEAMVLKDSGNVNIAPPAAILGANGGAQPTYTISAWIYRTDLSDVQDHSGWASWSAGDHCNWFQYGAGGWGHTMDGWASGYPSLDINRALVPANNWYNLTITNTGAGVKLYAYNLAGNLITTLSGTGSGYLSPDVFWVGAIQGPARQFQGAIASLRIYGFAATDSDVASLVELSKPEDAVMRTITVTPSAGIVVTPGTSQVIDGGSISFTIAASTGHVLDDVLLDGVSQGPVASLALTNVTANHTITTTSHAVTTFTVSGRVVAGGNPLAGAVVTISAVGTSPITTGADGTFSYVVNNGTYNVSVVGVWPYAPSPTNAVTVSGAAVNMGDIVLPAYQPLVDVQVGGVTAGPVTSIANAGTLGGNFTPFLGGAKIDAANGYKAMVFAGNGALQNSVKVPAGNGVIGSPTAQPVFTHVAWLYRPTVGSIGVYFQFAPYAAGALYEYGSVGERFADHWAAGGDMWWGGQSPAAGNWYCFVDVCDGVTETLYIDGVQTLQVARPAGYSFKNDADNYPINIGAMDWWANNDAFDRFYNGAVGSVQLWPAVVPVSGLAALGEACKPIPAVLHTITATAGEGVVLNPGTTQVLDGGSVTYTIAPALGYALTQVVVDGVVQTPIPSSYTFSGVVGDHTIAVSALLLPTHTVSGKVTDKAGVGIVGATVYFSATANATQSPVATATTGDGGVYIQPGVPEGNVYIAAGAAGYWPSADQLVLVDADKADINFALASSTRTIPAPESILYAAVTEDLPQVQGNSTDPWPTLGGLGALTRFGTPTVDFINNIAYVNNKFDGDGNKFAQGTEGVNVPINGATIVTVCKPGAIVAPNAYQCLVSFYLWNFSINVDRSNYRVAVGHNGFLDTGYNLDPTKVSILAYTVQPTGEAALFVNGAQVWSTAALADFTFLTPPAWYATDVMIGKGWEGDGWSSFNGLIGDSFIYGKALSDAERTTLQTDLAGKFGVVIPIYASISGKVTLADGTTPVAGINMRCNDGQTTTTAVDGTYSFTVSGDVNPVSYSITCQGKVGFAPIAPVVQLVDVTSQPVTGINFTVAPNLVNGRVINAAQAGVYNAIVQVGGTTGPAGITDADGYYSIAYDSTVLSGAVEVYADALGYANNAGSVTLPGGGGTVSAPTIVLDSKVETDASYIQNGGFETGALAPNWVLAPGDSTAFVEIGVSNVEKFTGSYSGSIKDLEGATTYAAWLMQRVPVVENSTYNVYFKVKGSGAFLSQCSWAFQDAAGNDIGYREMDEGLTAGLPGWLTQLNGSWQQAVIFRNWDFGAPGAACRIAIPAGAAFVRLSVGVSSATANDTLWVDDVVIDRVGPIYVPPVTGPVYGVNNKTCLQDSKLTDKQVKVWGKVQTIGATSYTISDGYSAPVTIAGTTTALVGDMVVVKGKRLADGSVQP